MPPQTRSRSSSGKPRVENSSVAPMAPVPRTSHLAKSTIVKAKDVKPEPAHRKRAWRAQSESVVAAPKHVRGKQGRLRGIMNMPVDIFAEIAVYLYPIDLVYLARANKFFRQMLMNRSFIHVWRCAERNVEGLPPCPKDLCQPQYAALVFTKYCSTCGNLALRPMDPVLQVRLCVRCRNKQAVKITRVTDPSLVFWSRDFVPGDAPWCLYDEAKAVKNKLNMLEHEGNKEETERWLEERRDIVCNRIKDAQPLALFLKNIDDKRSAELSDIKQRRAEEVKSRLLKLGWEMQDIENSNWSYEWQSLVHIAKPLTDRAWECIHPTLVAQVKSNRAWRLKRERDDRQYERRHKMRRWIDSIRKDMVPFAEALDIPHSNKPSSGAALLPGANGIESQSQSKQKRHDKLGDARTLRMAYPDKNTIMDWPAFKALEETEMTLEDLDQALQESRPTLDKLILKWTQELEQNLTDLLPKEASTGKDDSPSNIGHTISTQPAKLIPEYALMLGTGSDTQPITSLPTDIQRLLRADSAFMCWGSVSFYPDDFHARERDFTYNPQAGKIAKALLALLNLPDAAYLRLKAAGHRFACGRCDMGKTTSWKELIQHYIDEEAAYARVQENSAARSLSIKYIFMHDVDTVTPDKPLLRVVGNKERKRLKGIVGPSRLCLICKSVGENYRRQEITILDHIRNVHQIDDPQLGSQYR
ncbi:hypothetical protein FRC08_016960 [Ceratobasidium sp. 394]|nr:hypothetical protein FRC08_016960 [Ceratobasidium sp. 394]